MEKNLYDTFQGSKTRYSQSGIFTGGPVRRDGRAICEAEVVQVRSMKAFYKTNLLTIKVPKEYAMKACFFKAV